MSTVFYSVCTLVGTGFGAGLTVQKYIQQIPTKEDIRLLGEQYAAVSKEAAEKETRQNERLTAVEALAGTADKCCVHQSDRLDKFTTPARLGPF